MFLFGFRRFIAPSVIKFLYYLGLVFVVLGAIGTILYALAEMPKLGGPASMSMIFGAVIGAPLAILIMRFSAEMWLVLFEMNDRLGEIRDNTHR